MQRMKKHCGELWKNYGWTLCLMTAIYVVLYAGFLCGEYIYAYADIGSDTITQYLAKIIFDTNSIRNGTVGEYSLQIGLGGYYGNTFYSYLNPGNWPLLLFGEEHLQWGLLASLYVKYALICLFALLFFRHLLKDDKLAGVCALLWAFSGYLVLWGQHYQFLTVMTSFTFAMYGVQLFLEGDKKEFLLIPALASLAHTSYYFLYDSCFLFAVYSILYLAFHGVKGTDIFKKAGIFALAMIAAAGIAGDYLVPALAEFLESTRVSDVSVDRESMFWFYPLDQILATLGRFFSNDALGAGDAYTGPGNYYEAPILSVSVLAVFAFVMLLQSKLRTKTATVSCICAGLLCVPVVSQLLSFSYGKQRWTYIICFAEVILIGSGLKYLFQHYKQENFFKTISRTVVVTDAICLACIVLLWATRNVTGNGFCARAYLYVAAFLVVYSAFFLLMPRWKPRYNYSILAVIVTAELLSANYWTVNDREKVRMSDWRETMYYDGTEDVAQWIADQDSSIYRVNKTYDSAQYDDAMVQGYNGLAIYNSTNSAELSRLYTEFGYSLTYGTSSNWIRFDGNDVVANTLLGTKYIITKPETVMDDRFYKKINETEDFAVYESRYWLGFGYLYQNEISQADADAMNRIQRENALTECYYLTDGQTEEHTEQYAFMVDRSKTIDLIPYFSEALNCEVTASDVLEVTGTDDDMQIYFTCPEIPEGWVVSGMNVTITADSDSMVQLFLATDKFEFCEEQSDRLYYEAGTGIYKLDATSLWDVCGIRLDPSYICQDLTIESVELLLENTDELLDNLETMQQNSMIGFSQDGNRFCGTITNPEQEAMLCVPLVFSEHWTATVDGKAAKVYNINGGLVGIRLGTGTHEIAINYQDQSRRIGQIVCTVSLTLYLMGTFLWFRRHRRNTTKDNP